LTPLDHPRRWALVAAAAATVAAGWFLLVPIIAVYVTSADDPVRRDASTR